MFSFSNLPRSVLNKLNYIFSHFKSGKIFLLFILIVMSVFLETLSISFVLPTVSVLIDPTFSSDYINFIYDIFPNLQSRYLTIYFISALLLIFAIKNLVYAYLVYKKADKHNLPCFLCSRSRNLIPESCFSYWASRFD